MHKKTAHKNTPAPRLLDEIGATNLGLADAISEIVANSFDAAVDGIRLEVNVTVSSDEICVVDNGAGMTEDVLVEAVKLGKDMSKVLKRKTNAKGHFGLGLKTACASIGRWWAVRTRPLDSSVEYQVVFDLTEWERRPDDPESWTIEVEEWSPYPTDSPLGSQMHGTSVTVKKLRAKNPMAGAVLTKLGEAFKPHLAVGDSISVNGDPAQAYEYTFVPNSRVPIDLTFGTKDQYRITGWVALDRQTHNDGDFGFNIYRSGQLVQTWCQDWFAAHLMTSRIIGEVHMDFIDATFFKQGLQQSDVWKQASAEMREFLKPVVKASREVSRKGNVRSPVITQSIVSTLRKDLGLEASSTSRVDSTGPSGDPAGACDADSSDFELPKLRVEPESLHLESGVRIPLSSLEKDFPSPDTPFDYLWDGTTLLTVINRSHPLVQKSKSRDELRLLATADSILRFLMNECAVSGRRGFEVRNSWILAAMGASSSGGEGE